MVAHACDPRPWEAEVGGLRVQGQPGLQKEPFLNPSPESTSCPAFLSRRHTINTSFQQPSWCCVVRFSCYW